MLIFTHCVYSTSSNISSSTIYVFIRFWIIIYVNYGITNDFCCERFVLYFWNIFSFAWASSHIPFDLMNLTGPSTHCRHSWTYSRWWFYSSLKVPRLAFDQDLFNCSASGRRSVPTFKRFANSISNVCRICCERRYFHLKKMLIHLNVSIKWQHFLFN